MKTGTIKLFEKAWIYFFEISRYCSNKSSSFLSFLICSNEVFRDLYKLLGNLVSKGFVKSIFAFYAKIKIVGGIYIGGEKFNFPLLDKVSIIKAFIVIQLCDLNCYQSYMGRVVCSIMFWNFSIFNFDSNFPLGPQKF